MGLVMSDYDYDLFVIGAGSGGVRAGRMSAAAGARVAICEDRDLGGTCVNVGCVPKKLFSHGAHFPHAVEDAAGFGWSVAPPVLNWATLIANKNAEILRLNGIYERLLGDAGARVIRGRGTLVDAHTVEVAGQRHTAEHILVATGSRPFVPPIEGAEHGLSSDGLFHLERPPKRAIIIGGGYIAVEFASIFRGFGAEVALVHRGDRLLRGFDGDVRDHLAEELRKNGIELHLGLEVRRLDKRAHDEFVYTLSDGSELEGDLPVCAIGRVPNTAGLGLEEVGVELDARGAIVVDEHYASSVPSVHALGDVIDRVQLTPVALAEGSALAKTLFGGRPTTVDYENIATAVFSHPNIGTVGLGEELARERHGAVRVYRSSFRPLEHTMTGRDTKTLMKVIVHDTTDRVLGVHVVGDAAGEIVQGFAVALKIGATKAQFDATIGIHPTAAEELVTMRTPVSD